MPVRTGKQFIEGLRSRPREVWLRGERIGDVTAHPAFRRPVERLAHLYDMQHDPEYSDVLTYKSPSSGQPVGTAFMAPKSLEDLVKRRKAFQAWSEATFGLMGRSPDFMNTVLLAFAEAREVFARDGQKYADNLVKYYEFVRENDLFLSHALISPQTDRSKTSSEQVDPHLHMGVVKETPEGIIVRGARMLATMGPICDEMLIYNLPGLRPGDEPHAVAFAVPVDAPGLRQICREPYNWSDRSDYDHPLAANFEECDSLLIFNDVLIPWERVFIYNNVKLANALYPDTALRNHTGHQTNVRAMVKMSFAVGLAQALARSVKTDQFLHVQEKLGECMSYVELIRSAIVRAEVEHDTLPNGHVRASLAPLQALRGLLPTLYPRVIEVLQVIGAGGLLMSPSAADFNAPEIAGDVAKFYQGAEGLPSVERVRLSKIAWDLCGDSFGMRQLQYERFYAGDPVRILAMTYLGTDDRDYRALVDRAIAIAGETIAFGMSEASLIVLAGALVGGFVSGLTGFGTGISAMPIWLYGLTPALASPLVVVCSLIGQFQTLPAIWHAIDFRRCLPFIIGGLVGVPFGAWALPFVSVGVFKLAVGALLVAYCSFTLAGRVRLRVHGGGRIADALVGLGGGVMGGLAGISGPFPTIWSGLRGWEKDARRAVLQAFNTSILGFSLVAQAFTGLLTDQLWQLVLIALPGTILGSLIGRRLYVVLDSAKFEKAVLLLLLMSGAVLLAGGLRGA